MSVDKKNTVKVQLAAFFAQLRKHSQQTFFYCLQLVWPYYLSLTYSFVFFLFSAVESNKNVGKEEIVLNVLEYLMIL